MKNSAIVTDAPGTEDTQNGGLKGAVAARRQGRSNDAGGTAATVTFIALLGIAVALLGYMVVSG
ncbi:hypothetical protein HW130_15760 [Streptomyces sp. PKU-EA00015]|uniref:hypothetical protein n=1 Tax=Streptomyces sp. PKU-EA00015 TaxID=2748326 RepID=UPI0015A21C7B|nr:hypothetical protein [Streptomyces sp. PKU-EA00015]NWF27701.1 hypothetical protein [Streptomyces sp. PKU-EA00015]